MVQPLSTCNAQEEFELSQYLSKTKFLSPLRLSFNNINNHIMHVILKINDVTFQYKYETKGNSTRSKEKF